METIKRDEEAKKKRKIELVEKGSLVALSAFKHHELTYSISAVKRLYLA
jgi:hypothetical protein